MAAVAAHGFRGCCCSAQGRTAGAMTGMTGRRAEAEASAVEALAAVSAGTAEASAGAAVAASVVASAVEAAMAAADFPAAEAAADKDIQPHSRQIRRDKRYVYRKRAGVFPGARH